MLSSATAVFTPSPPKKKEKKEKEPQNLPNHVLQKFSKYSQSKTKSRSRNV
jgi:hypothetical protein